MYNEYNLKFQNKFLNFHSKFFESGVNKVSNKTFVNELYEKVHYEKTSKVSFCHQTFVGKNNLGSDVH